VSHSTQVCFFTMIRMPFETCPRNQIFKMYPMVLQVLLFQDLLPNLLLVRALLLCQIASTQVPQLIHHEYKLKHLDLSILSPCSLHGSGSSPQDIHSCFPLHAVYSICGELKKNTCARARDCALALTGPKAGGCIFTLIDPDSKSFLPALVIPLLIVENPLLLRTVSLVFLWIRFFLLASPTCKCSTSCSLKTP